MRTAIITLLTIASTITFAAEPIVGGPCEGCEAIFDGFADAPIGRGRIAPDGAYGQPMIIRGVVRDQNGRLRQGIVVYAYQTDADGRYQRDAQAPSFAGSRHGKYRGWVLSDQSGKYEFSTVRPAGYPNSDLPQHIHIHVLEPGCATYYLEDITFSDDTRMTNAKRREFFNDRGGSGYSTPQRVDGVWTVQRDITLGQAISDYPRCK